MKRESVQDTLLFQTMDQLVQSKIGGTKMLKRSSSELESNQSVNHRFQCPLSQLPPNLSNESFDHICEPDAGPGKHRLQPVISVGTFKTNKDWQSPRCINMDEWEDVLLTAPAPKAAPILQQDDSSSSESAVHPIIGAVSWLVDNKTGVFSSSSSSLSDDSEEARKSHFRAIFSRKDSANPKDSPKGPSSGLTRKPTHDSLRDSKGDNKTERKSSNSTSTSERKQSNSRNELKQSGNTKLEQPLKSIEPNECDTPENRLRITDCISRGEVEILEVLVKKEVDPNERVGSYFHLILIFVGSQRGPATDLRGPETTDTDCSVYCSFFKS